MKKLPRWAEYVVAIVLAAAFALGVQGTLVVRMKNRQNGMYPGLPAEKAYWIYRRAYAKPADVKRGDIVLIDSPTEGAAYRYTWRVVALPGEKVEVSGSKISIDGRELPRELTRKDEGYTLYREHNGDVSYEIAEDDCGEESHTSVTLPSDHFYLMGDNRCGAKDSRDLGPLPFSLFIGRKL